MFRTEFVSFLELLDFLLADWFLSTNGFLHGQPDFQQSFVLVY